MILVTLHHDNIVTEPAREYELVNLIDNVVTLTPYCPAWLESTSTFMVNKERVSGARVVEMAAVEDDYYPPLTVEDAIEVEGIYQQSTAREWAETMDAERI